MLLCYINNHIIIYFQDNYVALSLKFKPKIERGCVDDEKKKKKRFLYRYNVYKTRYGREDVNLFFIVAGYVLITEEAYSEFSLISINWDKYIIESN